MLGDMWLWVGVLPWASSALLVPLPCDGFNHGEYSPWIQLLPRALEPLAWFLKGRLQFPIGNRIHDEYSSGWDWTGCINYTKSASRVPGWARNRSLPDPQPSSLNPQPSNLNPQPLTLNPQPSTLNPQPSALNPQPSAHNHPAPPCTTPQTPNPKPQTPNPKSQTHTSNTKLQTPDVAPRCLPTGRLSPRLHIS